MLLLDHRKSAMIKTADHLINPLLYNNPETGILHCAFPQSGCHLDREPKNVMHALFNRARWRILGAWWVLSECILMARTVEQDGTVTDNGFLWRMGVAADSRSRVGIVVTLTAVAFALLDFVADMLGHHVAHDVAVAAVRAAIIGLAAGSVMWLGLIAVRQRRRHIAAEMNRIAELNHRIRNSLQVIVHAEHFAQDPLRSVVLESVEKIDKTLHDVLPSVRHN